MDIQIIEPKPGRIVHINFDSSDQLNRSQSHLDALRTFLERYDMTLCITVDVRVFVGPIDATGQATADAKIVQTARKVAQQLDYYIQSQREHDRTHIHFAIGSLYGMYVQELIEACKPFGPGEEAADG